MSNEDWQRAFQLIESNSRAIAAIADTMSQLQAGQAQLQEGQVQLQEGQALLTQVISEEQNSRQEFRRITNTALDLMERNLSQINRRLDALEQK